MLNQFSKKELEKDINRFLMLNDLPEVHNLSVEMIERVYPILCDVGVSYQGNFTNHFSKFKINDQYSLEEKLKTAKSLY